MEETEKLVQKKKKSEEDNLINFEDTVNNIPINNDNIFSTLSTQLILNFKQKKILNTSINLSFLPQQAIVYDYTTQPIIACEQKRVFLTQFNTTNLPFLRPIVIDGVGLVKAFRNCCCSIADNYAFPIVSIIRCMFYWISKGHSTILCFPSNFNPINDLSFNATRIQKTVLKTLQKFKLCILFKAQSEKDNKKWYLNILKEHRTCLITTISQWHLEMPNNLNSGVITLRKNKLNQYFYSHKSHFTKCPERVLQPFFSHDGELVFFSSFSAAGACVADMIVESEIVDIHDYKKIDKNQLSFIQQAKLLKILYDYLPKTSRFRETLVMVKVLHRLQPFLP